MRKSYPSIPTPFTVYVYMTKHKWIFKLLPFLKNRFAKVIGSFVCDRIDKYTFSNYEARYRINDVDIAKTCLNHPELIAYGKGKPLYGWHITEPKLFDKPKALSEFRPWCEKSRKTDDNLEMCCNCKNAFFDEDGAFYGCGLTRPSQSWCYVEE